MTRAEIEAKRGIVRDKNGHIIRTPEWIEARCENLLIKRADLKNRIKNIDAELTGYGKTIPGENVLKLGWWTRLFNLLKEPFING